MQKSTPATDYVNDVWVSFLDFAESLRRPLKADERRAMGWIMDIYDTQDVWDELREADIETHQRFDGMAEQILGLIDPEPCSRIAPHRCLENLETQPCRGGISVLQGVKLGYDVQPGTVLRNVDRLNDFLREADSILEQLQESHHVLGYSEWTDFVDRVVKKRQAMRLLGKTPKKLMGKINKRPAKKGARPSMQPRRPVVSPAEMAERRRVARRERAAAEKAAKQAQRDALYVPMFCEVA